MNRIVVSRTDSIGDVVLTLPMCGALKKRFPGCTIIFIGKNYTRQVIGLSGFVDEILSWDDYQTASEQTEALKALHADAIIHAFPDKTVVLAAHRAQIPERIATGRRSHTFVHCNRRIWFSRKNSDLHESQLNFALLKHWGINTPSLQEIPTLYGFNKAPDLDSAFEELLDRGKKNVVLHPKSKGSAVEWPIEKFNELIDQLGKEQFNVFISGTQAEGDLVRGQINWGEHVTDLTGKMSLEQYIAFLNRVDAIVAGSTGPLHIASALGTIAIGLYSPARPIHPGRWMPVGEQAHFIENDEAILDGVLSIPASAVKAELDRLLQV